MQNRSPLRSLTILKSNNMKISDRLIKKSHMRLFEGLKTGGFIIGDSIDEKAILKYEQLCSDTTVLISHW